MWLGNYPIAKKPGRLIGGAEGDVSNEDGGEAGRWSGVALLDKTKNIFRRNSDVE